MSYMYHMWFSIQLSRKFSIFRRSHPLSSRFWLRVWNGIPCTASGWIFVSSALRSSRIISTKGAHSSIKVSIYLFNISKVRTIWTKNTLDPIKHVRVSLDLFSCGRDASEKKIPRTICFFFTFLKWYFSEICIPIW